MPPSRRLLTLPQTPAEQQQLLLLRFDTGYTFEFAFDRKMKNRVAKNTKKAVKMKDLLILVQYWLL
jgi:hypothetical protein